MFVRQFRQPHGSTDAVPAVGRNGDIARARHAGRPAPRPVVRPSVLQGVRERGRSSRGSHAARLRRFSKRTVHSCDDAGLVQSGAFNLRGRRIVVKKHVRHDHRAVRQP